MTKNERIVVQMVWHGVETWGLKKKEKMRLKVMETKCLRSMCGVTRMDRIRNDEIRRGVGVQNRLLCTVENCVLRCFGHVERMDDKAWQRGYMILECRGRPTRVWMDGVREVAINIGLTLEQARSSGMERSGELVVKFG